MRTACVGVGVVFFAANALAFAGPESVAVLANQSDAESVTLADAYAAARSIPSRQICKLAMPQTDDVSFTDYQTLIQGPFEACLKTAGVIDRIEAVVVMRGVPLRVAVPISTGTTNTSLAATLAIWHSTIPGDAGTGPLLGQEPGQIVNCGSPCYGARWNNPLQFLTGPLTAGYSAVRDGVQWQPIIVTMLTGRSLADAQMLIQSAVDAEKSGGAKGTFLFMDGADSARGVLDTDFPNVITQLKALGYTDAQEVPFNAALTGQTLASFVVGTASLGTTIESNTYLPGSLVDNLTSFGAVPQNFAPTGESQVSIARWVEKGVGGAHGTVDEPLNNVFPRRFFLVDYAKGAPLGEAYFRWLPFQYWKNLVLGDPMLAPYAKRPTVTITGLSDGATSSDAVMVTATATDTAGVGIAKTQLYVDGVLAGEAAGDTIQTCVKVPAQAGVQVLAVAQTNTGTGGLAKFPPKGWTAIHVTGQASGKTDCGSSLDAGSDADAGTTPPPSGGCSCRVGSSRDSGAWSLGALALALVVRGRSSRASRSRPRP